jgi:hypothetical protein
MPHPVCAVNRGCEHCFECLDLDRCERFNQILEEYPDHKSDLLRLQQQNHLKKPILRRGYIIKSTANAISNKVAVNKL